MTFVLVTDVGSIGTLPHQPQHERRPGDHQHRQRNTSAPPVQIHHGDIHGCRCSAERQILQAVKHRCAA